MTDNLLFTQRFARCRACAAHFSPIVRWLLLATICSLPGRAANVIGYFPSWGTEANIPYAQLTHLNYAFLLPTASGGVQPLANPAQLQTVVANAHRNGVKVSISIGGGGNGTLASFERFAATEVGRTTFINQVLAFVAQYNLDGVDIDWEYPNPGKDAVNYGTLIEQLGTPLHAQGKLLSTAVVGLSEGDGVPVRVFTSLDFLNVMAYDNPTFPFASYDYAVQLIGYWTGRGCPKSIICLGVPFYGQHSNRAVTNQTYAAILALGADPSKDVFGVWGYNGIATMKKKMNLVYDQGYAGLMIWEIDQDVLGPNSLLTAVNQVVAQRQGNLTRAPWITGQPASQTINAGNAVTFTAAINGPPAPFFQWKKNGVAIPGASSHTYTIASVSASDAGDYTVAATNTLGSITSTVATLTVMNGISGGFTPARSGDRRNVETARAIGQ